MGRASLLNIGSCASAAFCPAATNKLPRCAWRHVPGPKTGVIGTSARDVWRALVVELCKLEHFDHRVARLTASEIRDYKAAAIKRPLRQRFTAEEVHSDDHVSAGFYDRVERYRRQRNSINQPLLTPNPWRVKTRD